MVKLLLDNKPDMIDAKNDFRYTPLFCATAENGRFSFGIRMQKCFFLNHFIHFLFYKLNVEIGTENLIKYLISKGANINAKDMDNRTPLHLSAMHGKRFGYTI